MKKGIDLSCWQTNVDYKKLKEEGIEFAIIRCGYGKDAVDEKGKPQKDSMFETHYKGCKEAGIKVGAYHYSYCSKVENAILEAQNCLSFIKGKEFDLPIYYDLENSRTKVLGIDQITQIALIFCRELRNNGYRTGVYANLDWFKNYIRPEALELEGFSIWLAQWNNEITANFNPDIWQFTNDLKVANIKCDGDYLLNEDILNNEDELELNIYNSLAVDSIFGKYGNGIERKEKLGCYYDETQNVINKLYKVIKGD